MRARDVVWPGGSGPPTRLRLVALDTVGSTNDVARELAENGAPEFTCVWAQRQTGGRGRRGRAWDSPRGNLFCSFVLRPRVPLSMAAQLSFAAALAVSDTLRDLLGPEVPVTLKWPNDVLADDAKVSGVLLEAEATDGGDTDFVVLGVGINVRHAPTDTPYPATSLAALGADTDAGEVLGRLAAALEQRVDAWLDEGFDGLRRAWLARARGLGEPIEVRLPDHALTGRFRGLADDGALLLALADGGERRIAAGEVFFGTGR